MTGERLLVDTNVLVFHLGGDARATRAIQDAEVHISFVTEIELLSHGRLTDADLENIRASLNWFSISDVNPAIKEKAAALRRRHRLKLADALIAATAVHLNAPLLTADGDFLRLAEVVDVRLL